LGKKTDRIQQKSQSRMTDQAHQIGSDAVERWIRQMMNVSIDSIDNRAVDRSDLTKHIRVMDRSITERWIGRIELIKTLDWAKKPTGSSKKAKAEQQIERIRSDRTQRNDGLGRLNQSSRAGESDRIEQIDRIDQIEQSTPRIDPIRSDQIEH
jgi:hypothetical protein